MSQRARRARRLGRVHLTHGRAHFYRALLESVAYEYALACRALRSAAPDLALGEVRVTGGGAASDLWNRIKADVLGLPYVRLAVPDASTLGSAILAGHAVGLIPDMAAVARRAARPGSRHLPDAAAHVRYRAAVNAYRAALRHLGGAYAALADLRTADARKTPHSPRRWPQATPLRTLWS